MPTYSVPPTERAALLELLEQGAITQAEAADLAGVSRAAISQWCAKAKIDPKTARADRVQRLYHSARTRHEDRPRQRTKPGPKPKPKRRGMRKKHQ